MEVLIDKNCVVNKKNVNLKLRLNEKNLNNKKTSKLCDIEEKVLMG